MARQIEIGIKYFPFETGIFSDRKIKKLLLTFGAKGFLVYIFVLCEIYKDKGYYIQCDDDFLLDIAYSLNLPETVVKEIISFCVSNVLFDKRVFDVEKVLTSSGIQKRFLEIKKRSNVSVLNNLRINVTENDINVTKKPINATLIPQKKSKVKKSKEYSNEYYMSGVPPDTPVSSKESQHVSIDFEKLICWFNETTKGVFGTIKHPISDKRKKMLRARISEHGKESFVEVVNNATKSDFLRGQNTKSWTATFDWLIKPSNYEKVLSGNYKNSLNGTNQRTNKTGNQRPTADELSAAVEYGIALAQANEN